MNASQLEHKTIRPGSLSGYSYYHSNRIPNHVAAMSNNSVRGKHWKQAITVITTIALIYVGFTHIHVGSNSTVPQITPHNALAVSSAVSVSVNHCGGNKLNKLIKVSVSQRHLWACDGGKTVQEAPVITGMLAHASTLTPPGMYHIYSKTTNTTLTGADETGSWSDPVSYWMPFLDNQHGTYGFHDATWRPADAFGKVSPGSSDASHGCVELPLQTSKWLYDWAAVGTAVSIES